ncbi:hypothetical protein M0Q50_06650 [bacterium]|jgi:hypothetical protein|nr:hypothetical protein [bacterium]
MEKTKDLTLMDQALIATRDLINVQKKLLKEKTDIIAIQKLQIIILENQIIELKKTINSTIKIIDNFNNTTNKAITFINDMEKEIIINHGR